MTAIIVAGAVGLLIGLLLGIAIGWWAHGKTDLINHDPYDDGSIGP